MKKAENNSVNVILKAEIRMKDFNVEQFVVLIIVVMLWVHNVWRHPTVGVGSDGL